MASFLSLPDSEYQLLSIYKSLDIFFAYNFDSILSEISNLNPRFYGLNLREKELKNSKILTESAVNKRLDHAQSLERRESSATLQQNAETKSIDNNSLLGEDQNDATTQKGHANVSLHHSENCPYSQAWYIIAEAFKTIGKDKYAQFCYKKCIFDGNPSRKSVIDDQLFDDQVQDKLLSNLKLYNFWQIQAALRLGLKISSCHLDCQFLENFLRIFG